MAASVRFRLLVLIRRCASVRRSCFLVLQRAEVDDMAEVVVETGEAHAAQFHQLRDAGCCIFRCAMARLMCSGWPFVW